MKEKAQCLSQLGDKHGVVLQDSLWRVEGIKNGLRKYQLRMTREEEQMVPPAQ